MFPNILTTVNKMETMKIEFYKSITTTLSRDDKARSKVPTLTYTHGQPILIIKDLIDVIDINHLNSLSECVKASFPAQFLNRSFDTPLMYEEGVLSASHLDDESAGGYKGGNTVIFIEGFMQKLMPDFVEYIMRSLSDATSKANWHPYPRHLGLRCIESLCYFSGGELSYHTDSGSIFTVVIMLSDPINSFTGGDFVIKNKTNDKDEILRITPSLGDAIIFDSCSMHGVDTIMSGQRNVLVIELWPYEDSDQGDKRPGSDRYRHRIKIPALVITPSQNL